MTTPIDRLREICQEYDLAPIQYLEVVVDVLDDHLTLPSARAALLAVIDELEAGTPMPPPPAGSGVTEETPEPRVRPMVPGGLTTEARPRPAPRLKDVSARPARPRLPDGLGQANAHQADS